MKRQRIPWIFLGLIVGLIWSSSTYAQITVDGRYWKYNGRRVLLLGAWNHGHNPFIDHDTDNDNRGVSTIAQIKNAMDELVAAGGNYLRCVLDPAMVSGTQLISQKIGANTIISTSHRPTAGMLTKPIGIK
jgi:hypothetical protein